MSAVILGIGIATVVLAAIAISEEEIVRIVKELISLLVRTMSYGTDEIIRIIRLYC
ncbi:MAG: hypothetical protein ACM3UL_00615 [Ignavibacteria bacterium]